MKKLLLIASIATLTLVVGSLIAASFMVRSSHNENRSTANESAASPVMDAKANEYVKSAGIAIKQPAPSQVQSLRTTVTQANFVQGHQPAIQKSAFNPTPSKPLNNTRAKGQFNLPPAPVSGSTAIGTFATQGSILQPARKPTPQKVNSNNSFGTASFQAKSFRPPSSTVTPPKTTNSFGPPNRVAYKTSVWPVNAQNVKNLVRTEYSLPPGAADSIVDFFAADDNENIETKISKSEDTTESLVKLIVTTDEKTQRAIASFLDAVYSAKRLEEICKSDEPEASEDVGFGELTPSAEKEEAADSSSELTKPKSNEPKKEATVKDLFNGNKSVSQTLNEINDLIGSPEIKKTLRKPEITLPSVK